MSEAIWQEVIHGYLLLYIFFNSLCFAFLFLRTVFRDQFCAPTAVCPVGWALSLPWSFLINKVYSIHLASDTFRLLRQLLGFIKEH